MGRRCHGAGFGPGEQFMGRDEAFPDLQVLLTIVGYPLGKLLRMRQKEVHIESACSIKHLFSGLQTGALAGIGSPDFPGLDQSTAWWCGWPVPSGGAPYQNERS